MTVPNPNPSAPQPSGPVHNPVASPAAGAPMAYPQQPFASPVVDAGPPQPPRPKLTKAAAHRARLAGGVGGGLAWLGLGIAQLSAALLLLPLFVGALVFGVGFAIQQDGSSATAGVWDQTLAWLGSPWGIALAIGIPVGIAVALLGLWVSTRMLKHPGLRGPVGVTWAGFGISVAATVLLSGLGSFALPFFGGLPFGDAFDVDMQGFDSGAGPGAMDEEQLQEWLAHGGAGVLEQLADPATLLGFLGPWIALGQLLALIVPIGVSVFAWWWMAHAMRPAAADAPDPSAPAAGAADAGSASAA